MIKTCIVIGLGVAILLSASSSVKAQTAASPAAVTDTFYKRYIAYQMRGLPSEKQVTMLAPLFSNEIMKMIAADRAQQKTFIKQHPDEKPPWVEGDLFSSLFEGSTSFSLGKSRVQKTRAEVDVHLVY